MTAPTDRVGIIGADPELCRSALFVLEADGFEVRLFGSSSEASKPGDCLDAFLIFDQEPDVDGVAEARILRRSFRSVAILLLANELVVSRRREADGLGVHLVDLPFTGEGALGQIVREALQRGPV